MGVETEHILDNLSGLLENFAVSRLEGGRVNFDVFHMKAVVYYAGMIARREGLNELVMVTTAWLHDLGYYGLFEDSDSGKIEEVYSKKEQHMINGAIIAREFLNRDEIRGYYEDDDLERIVYLVGVHDKVNELEALDELAFMEADTLGSLDVDRVTPTFDRENAIKYLNTSIAQIREPKFTTQTGLRYFNYLLPRFKAHFEIS